MVSLRSNTPDVNLKMTNSYSNKTEIKNLIEIYRNKKGQ